MLRLMVGRVTLGVDQLVGVKQVPEGNKPKQAS